jgi:fructose-specific phosphotransferase system IIB component
MIGEIMKIVGVTACPTGIAHTYMAAEALEKECKRRGIEVKIETQGSIGPENELTQDEVDEADVVILAVGIVIEGMERFENRPTLEADVSKAISHPEKVVDAAIKLARSEGE